MRQIKHHDAIGHEKETAMTRLKVTAASSTQQQHQPKRLGQTMTGISNSNIPTMIAHA
jgi:hypothetical protein